MRYTVVIVPDVDTTITLDLGEFGIHDFELELTDDDWLIILGIIEREYRLAADALIYLVLAQWRFVSPKLTGALTAGMQAFVNSHIDLRARRVYIYLDFTFKRALWSVWNGLVNLYRPDLIDYPLNYLESLQAGTWLVNQIRRGV